jgi:hypothetical protein
MQTIVGVVGITKSTFWLFIQTIVCVVDITITVHFGCLFRLLVHIPGMY